MSVGLRFTMFTPPADAQKKRRSRARLISLGLHGALLLALLYRAAPVLLTPSEVALGTPGSSGSVSIVYLAPVGPEKHCVRARPPTAGTEGLAVGQETEAAKAEPERQAADNATVSDVRSRPPAAVLPSDACRARRSLAMRLFLRCPRCFPILTSRALICLRGLKAT